MNSVIGELLPLAIGIAISPVPIIAAVLMLLSPRAKSTGTAFSAGWLGGIVVAVTAFVLLAAVLPRSDSTGSKPVAGVIKLLLGAALLLLALRQFRRRNDEATMPAWMSAIDGMTAAKGGSIGFLVAAVNPKNLAMAAAAGVAVGTSGLATGSQVVAVTVFAVIAASTVAVPTVAYLVSPEGLAAPLTSLKNWLVAHNAVVMSVLMLVLGVAVVGKGIGSF